MYCARRQWWPAIFERLERRRNLVWMREEEALPGFSRDINAGAAAPAAAAAPKPPPTAASAGGASMMPFMLVRPS